MTSYLGMGLALAAMISTVALQSRFERQLNLLGPTGNEVRARLSRLWFATVVVAVAIGLFFALGKTPTALYITIGILLANASVVALFKHRVLSQITDAHTRARLRRISLAQLTASITMFAGAAVYLLARQ